MSAIADLFGFGKDEEMATVTAEPAEQARRTAEPVEQLSEAAKRKRRTGASLITRGWAKPKLGAAGMLGI